MRRAIELSRNGFPAPNPHVGCVIVKDGDIVGEGWHEYAGGLHAEAVALQQAGSRARGADLYVTLEPCNHMGRQPPCAAAVVAAGVRRVVIACLDPNPKAAGGADALRQHGVQVETHVLEAEAAEANEVFLFAHRHKRPMVVAKAAMSLDGRIALPSGESKWITGEEARRQAHRLRAELGTVLVGRATVELDDPQLTARIEGVRNQPLRVVLDPSGRLGRHCRVFDDQARTLHVTGSIDLRSLLRDLFDQGQIGVLVEGGARTLVGFLREDLVDRLELFVAPKILGSGPSWIEGLSLERLENAVEWDLRDYRPVGSDLWLRGVKKRKQDV